MCERILQSYEIAVKVSTATSQLSEIAARVSETTSQLSEIAAGVSETTSQLSEIADRVSAATSQSGEIAARRCEAISLCCESTIKVNLNDEESFYKVLKPFFLHFLYFHSPISTISTVGNKKSLK